MFLLTLSPLVFQKSQLFTLNPNEKMPQLWDNTPTNMSISLWQMITWSLLNSFGKFS